MVGLCNDQRLALRVAQQLASRVPSGACCTQVQTSASLRLSDTGTRVLVTRVQMQRAGWQAVRQLGVHLLAEHLAQVLAPVEHAPQSGCKTKS